MLQTKLCSVKSKKTYLDGYVHVTSMFLLHVLIIISTLFSTQSLDSPKVCMCINKITTCNNYQQNSPDRQIIITAKYSYHSYGTHVSTKLCIVLTVYPLKILCSNTCLAFTYSYTYSVANVCYYVKCSTMHSYLENRLRKLL